MAMSSLVQRQSERQGIFFVALSPFKRGAGGVNISLTFSQSALSLAILQSFLSYSAPSSLSYSGLTGVSR